jgi:hypothetical protein
MQGPVCIVHEQQLDVGCDDCLEQALWKFERCHFERLQSVRVDVEAFRAFLRWLFQRNEHPTQKE